MMRTPFRFPSRHVLTTALALGALATGACGKQEPAAPPTPPPSAVTAPEAPPEPPPAPPSPLANAEALLSQPVVTPEAITAALQEAEALSTWAEANPGLEAARARLTSARLRLVAVAAAAGLDGEAAQRALGGEARQLASIRATLDQLAQQPADGVDPKPVADALQAILGADPEQKEVTFDRAAAEALAMGTTLEGAAVRVLWLARYQRALDALRGPTAELAVPTLSRAVGRLLCATCADAHHVTADVVTRFLLNPKNTDGIVCASAVAAAQPAEGAAAVTTQLEALASCREALGLADPTDPAVYWGTNVLAVATLHKASALAGAPAPEGALAGAIAARREAVEQRLAGLFALPVPLVADKLPESGERAPGDLPAMVDGLGVGGLTPTKQALPTVVVGPDAVKVGLRPLVEVRDGRVVALNPELDLPSAGRPILTFDALAAAKPADGEPGLPEVNAAAADLRAALDKVAGRVSPAALGAGEAGGVVNVAVDAQAPAWAVVKTLDALKAAGFEHVRFLKTATHTRQLPLLVRTAPEGRTAGFTRPLVAVVGATHVDVWTPEGDGPEGAKKDADAKPPEGLEPGYKGKDLVRLRVALPDGLGATALQQVEQAVGYFEKVTGAAGTLHVVAGEGARAADVLRVAQAYQEKAGKELADPASLWPEVACGGPDYARARRTPEGCATQVAIAFSSVDEPSSKGIRSSVVEKKDAPPKKADPPPEAGFCNQNDIRVNMNKRMGAFRFCYERELQLKRDIEGRVVLKFTIGLDGGVSGEPTIASSTLKDEAVHGCLLNNLKKVKFAKPEGGVCVVQYPFVFKKN